MYDLIYVEADEGFYIIPRQKDSLKTIYERTQLGTSGLHSSIGFIPKNKIEAFIKIYPALKKISDHFNAEVEGYDGGSSDQYNQWIEDGCPDIKEWEYE